MLSIFSLNDITYLAFINKVIHHWGADYLPMTTYTQDVPLKEIHNSFNNNDRFSSKEKNQRRCYNIFKSPYMSVIFFFFTCIGCLGN